MWLLPLLVHLYDWHGQKPFLALSSISSFSSLGVACRVPFMYVLPADMARYCSKVMAAPNPGTGSWSMSTFAARMASSARALASSAMRAASASASAWARVRSAASAAAAASRSAFSFATISADLIWSPPLDRLGLSASCTAVLASRRSSSDASEASLRSRLRFFFAARFSSFFERLRSFFSRFRCFLAAFFSFRSAFRARSSASSSPVAPLPRAERDLDLDGEEDGESWRRPTAVGSLSDDEEESCRPRRRSFGDPALLESSRDRLLLLRAARPLLGLLLRLLLRLLSLLPIAAYVSAPSFVTPKRNAAAASSQILLAGLWENGKTKLPARARTE